MGRSVPCRVAAAWCVQVGFKWLLWHPYVSDPLMNFVDLMYLANVSLVLLDEPHCGYYVHGRNHSQHSDATLM